MKKNLLNPILAVRLGIVSLTLAVAPSVLADSLTWGGESLTSANWTDAANWTNSLSANAVPATGDYLSFPYTLQTSITNDLTGLSVAALTFPVGDFLVFGNGLTISSGITNVSGNNTVGTAVTLGGAQSFSSQAGATLNIAPNVNVNTAGNPLSFTDGGDFNLFGVVSGGGGLTFAGTGNVVITNKQPLTGGIFVNGGLVTVTALANLNFGGALTPSLITVNTNGTILGNGTHAIGGGTSMFVNRGDWQLNFEDYKQNLTMWDGKIDPGPNPNSSGGELRVGLAGGAGSFTWYITNSITGSLIESPFNTIGSAVNLTLDVARGAAPSDLTIDGPIKNAGNITIVRNGITTITGNNGANTFTGTLTVNGGKVVLTGALWATLINLATNTVLDVSATSFTLATNQVLSGIGTVIGTVNDNDPGALGAAISPGGVSVGTLTMDGLNLNGNATLNFNLSTVTTVGGGVNDLITVTNLSLSSGNTNTVNFSFSGTPAAGAYTLIQYPVGHGPAAGPVTTIAAAASRSTYAFTSTGTSIQVTVVANPAPLVWRGDGATNKWDLGVTTNWLNGAVKDVFLTGDNATFNDVGSNTPPVNLVGTISANQVTVAGSKDYTFGGSGKLSGGAKLVKTNSATLTILTPNDNSGGGLLSGGAVTVGNGSPTVANIGSGLLTNNTKVTFFENASATYAGNMTGTGSVTAFMPAATLTLTGSNTFTGGLTIQNGTLQIGNASVASVTGSITNYATLNLYRSDAFTNKNNITSAGNSLEYGTGDINVRGVGGMTVDGSGSINLLPQGSLSVAQSAYGKLTVNPGGLINLGANFLIGNPTANNADIIQNGGTITVGNQVRIGHWGTEISTYAMNGGILNVMNGDLGVGWDGIGLLTMTNGIINCRTLSVDDNGATATISGTNSTFTLTGGTINIGTGGITGSATNALIPTIFLSGGTIGTLVPSTLIAAGWSSTMNLRLTNGTTTFDTSNSVITLSGGLTGNGSLIKQGTGNLLLNNTTNSYAGTTTVAAGTLQGSGTVAGPLVVQSGATLSAGAINSAGTLTTSNVTVNSGASVVIDASSTAATSDLLFVKGALALDAATPLTMNFLGGLPYTGGPYTVLTNLLAGRTGHLVLAPTGLTRYAAAVDETNPNRIQVSFTGTNANLVWRGNVSTNWNINTDANWLNAGSADKYFQSDVVIFDDSGLTKSNVNLTTAMTPASITVDSSGNYAFGGSPIAGTTTLTKSGTGKLTLVNSNAYTGVTTIAGGTLQVGNGGTSGYLTGGTVNDYGSLVFNRSDTVNFNGAINGSGTLTQAGSGTLLITATQNHYGGSTINPGSTVQLGNGTLGDSGSLGNGTVTNNGTVNFYRLSSIAVATPYTGGGAFNFLGTGNAAQSAYSLNATNTITGPVTLSYARIQSGLGALSFGSPSSVTVNPGSQVYAVATPASLVYNIPLTLAGTGWQDGLGALRIENIGNWSGPITLASNARIGVNNATTNIISGTISGSYELEAYGGNATAGLVLAPTSANTYNALRVSIGTAGAKTIAGNNNAIPDNIPLTMNGGTLWLNGFSKSFAPFLNLSGSSSIQNGSSNAMATATLAPVLGNSTYNGTFADGSSQPLNVTFTQTPGLWTLALPTASPNWTGNLTNNGGTISSGTQNTPFGSQGVVGRSIVGNSGAAFLTTLNNVLNGYSGNIVLNNSTWFNNRYISMNPNAGYLSLANSTMTGTNSSDGNYETWQLPTLVMVRGTAPSYMLGGGSSPAFDVQLAGTTFDVADATGNASADLVIGGASATFLHSPANTTSGGSLTKTGAGTLELDGANTYTGPTVINAGTLTLGAAATLATSSITLSNGATFDVSAIPAGLTLAANQTLAGSGLVKGSILDGTTTLIQPGGNGTAGTLTINNNLTLNGNGSLNIDLSSSTGSGNDLIQVNGALNLAGATPTVVNFNFLNGAAASGSYTLIQAASISGTVATAFTNVSRYAATFTQSGSAVVVTFTGSASNLVWTGTDPLVASTWDVATSTNWSDGSAGNIFYQNDNVRFDDTSANTTVTLASTVRPQSITVDTANSYEITGSGAISGTTGIIKTNTGTLTLGTVNTFSGAININAGKLTLGVNDALPPNAVVTVATNAVFDFTDNNGNTTTRGYTFIVGGAGPDGNGAMVDSVDGGGIASFACVSNLILTADTVINGIERWDIGSDPNSKLDGQGHSLIILGSGNGKIDLRSQLMTNVASITISNPITWYENYNQTNAWTANTTNYVSPGSALGNYGARIINVPIVLNAASIQNYGGGSPAIWTGGILISNTSVFNNSAAQVFSGVVSGSGGIRVGGASTTAGTIPGILTFSNANTFTGGITLSNVPVTVGLGTAVAGNAAVIVTSSNGLGSGPITLDLSMMTTNAMTNTARAIEFNITGGGVIPNAIILPATTSGVTNLSLQGRDSSSVFTLSGQISGGFAGLTNWVDFGDAASSGVMRLANNANNFLGNIYGDRGVLAITGDGCLGNAANLVKLDQASVNGGLRFDGAAVNVAHALIANSAISLDVYGDNNGDGVAETANSSTISGIVGGGGAITVKCGVNITPASFGTLSLLGNNGFTGALTISSFVKAVAGHANALGTTAGGTTVNSGGTLSLNLGGTYASEGLTLNGSGVSGVGALENLSGADILNGNITLASSSSIGVTAGSLALGGVISGAFPLTKVGPGALTLSGANSYSAGTIINNGSLFVNGSLPVGNAVSVNGGTLAGVGTINAPVTSQIGSTLSPGVNTIGKLTVNSSVNLLGTAIMEVSKAASTNDSLAGISALYYGGTLTVSNLGGSYVAGDSFKLFSAQSYQGGFAATNLPNISPLTWVWTPANGTLSVVSGVNLTPTNIITTVTGNQLILSWPADHTGWTLQAQTNGIGTGLNSAWVSVPNSELNNGYTNTINPVNPTVFFRLYHP